MVFALPPALSPAPHPCLQEHQPDAKLGLQTRPPALYFFRPSSPPGTTEN